jgi:hypothetical protein
VTHIPSDALWSNRVVNDELWAIVTDPEIGADPDAVIVTADGSFRTLSGGLSLYPWHLFDAIAFNGRTYIAGAYRTQAKDGTAGQSWAQVWRNDTRADGAAIWPASLTVKSNYRTYGLGIIGSTLYAMLAGGAVRKTNDGVTWTTAPGAVSSAANNVTPFMGGLVYLYGWPANGAQSLMKYDGSKAINYGGVNAFCVVDGDVLYALVGSTVRRTYNLTDWDTVCTDPPTNGRSLAVMDGALYVGTADSHVWRRA